MNLTVFATCWLIVLARIIDVSLDTIRMVSVVQGRRVFAAVLGFFQAVEHCVFIVHHTRLADFAMRGATKPNKRKRS